MHLDSSDFASPALRELSLVIYLGLSVFYRDGDSSHLTKLL